MRTILPVLLIGCGGAAREARETCERYVTCATAVSADLGADATALYGKEGTCWDAASTADCEDQCEEETVALWYSSDEARCDPEPLGMDPGLTPEEFQEQYAARSCAEFEDCNTGSGECPTYVESECAGYDPDAAEACLSGTWVCDTQFPGFEFPIPPTPCTEVCAGSTTYASY